MSNRDGGEVETRIPVVSIMAFGDIETDLVHHVCLTLKEFFRAFSDFIEVQPTISISYYDVPGDEKTAVSLMKTYLEISGGNIVLGLTNEGIWDPSPPRYIFGLGSGLVSLKRFRSDCSSWSQIKSRFGKEVIKILSLVAGMGSCEDRKCLLQYHWNVEDFDSNIILCERCRAPFGIRLSELLRVEKYSSEEQKNA
jgi:predicted Zn-dependent protease